MRVLFNVIIAALLCLCLYSAGNEPEVAGAKVHAPQYLIAFTFFALIGIGGNYYWNRGN